MPTVIYWVLGFTITADTASLTVYPFAVKLDRLIASLQEGSSTTTSASELELEDVKNERDLLREELDSVQSELESCRVEMADAEAQVRGEIIRVGRPFQIYLVLF